MSSPGSPNSNSDLPDLPALESVQTRGNASLWIVMVYGSFIMWQSALVALLSWRYWRYVEPSAYWPLGLFAVLILWLVVRVLTGYTSFATDPQGLTMRGPLFRKFVPWVDVREARSKVRSNRTTLVLTTDRGTRSISPGATGSSEGEVVVASAWQHLRRLGKAGAVELSEQALKLWEPIPGDVPWELDWGGPPKKSAKIGNVIGAAFFPAMILTMVIWDPRMSLFYAPIFIISLVMLEKTLFLPELRKVARQVSIRPDGIQAKMLFGDSYLPWATVTSAWWQSQNNIGYLCVRSKGPDAEVWLPYTLGKRESEQMVLSTIRYLRSAGTPQAVPMPVIVSRGPEYLNQAAFSSQQPALLQRAFLNTLEPAVAKRIQWIYGLGVLTMLLGFAAGAVVGFLDVPGRISARVFSTPDTTYFIPSLSMAIAIPLMIAGAFVGTGIAELVARKAAGPNSDVWVRFSKVGSGSGKFKRGILWFFGSIAALGILSVPLFVCSYTRITDKGIVMNRPLRFHEQLYTWQQVRQIMVLHKVRIHNGHSEQDLCYRVVFADRTDWEIGDDGFRAKQQMLQSVMDYAARKSGRPIIDIWKQ